MGHPLIVVKIDHVIRGIVDFGMLNNGGTGNGNIDR